MSNERFVQVKEVGENAVEDLQQGFTDEPDALDPQPVEFTTKEYKTFRVEYTLRGNDFVIHFFLPTSVTERNAHQYRDWWLREFSSRMDACAQEHFEAGPPRLQARYTEEVASWWLKAQGFGHLLTPLKFLERFFSTLDASCLQTSGHPG